MTSSAFSFPSPPTFPIARAVQLVTTASQIYEILRTAPLPVGYNAGATLPISARFVFMF
jgi:hypothetical protein